MPMRRSKQRDIILDELMKLESHPSAAEIYERVRARMPRISLGTVYRNLELFAREGIVRRIPVDGETMRYDKGGGGHVHIRCVRCGRIDDVTAPMSRVREDRRVARITGYRVIERRIQYLGLCPSCARKKGAS